MTLRKPKNPVPGRPPVARTEPGGATGLDELWAAGAEAEVELARLIVDPRARGQGLGRRLALELAGLTATRT